MANDGTTWTPVFDSQGSYLIGTVIIDPKNPSTIWVGTGGNNTSAAYPTATAFIRARMVDIRGTIWGCASPSTSRGF